MERKRTAAAVRNCTMAAALVAGALVLRFLVDPVMGDQLPFWTFWLASGLAVWRGGLGPALIVVVSGYFLASYFFIPPRGKIEWSGLANVSILTGYLVVSAIICGLGVMMRLSAAALVRQNRRIQLLQQAAAHMLSSRGSIEDIRSLYDHIAEFIGADVFLECALDKPGEKLQLQLSGSVPPHADRQKELQALFEAMCRDVPVKRSAVSVPDVQTSKDPDLYPLKKAGIRSYICHPLIAGERILGTLAFASHRREHFDREDESFFRTLGSYVAIARDRARLTDELKRYTSHLETIVSERTALLEERSERLRAIVSNAVDGIITIDENGTMETVNPATEKIFGYTSQEMIGENIKMLMPEPYRSMQEDYLAHYRATGEHRMIGVGREVEGRRKDGSIFPMDLAVSESWLGERRIFTGLVRDITRRKEVEARLRETTEELEQFSYSIIHDMRAPLRAMRGFGELLQHECANALDEMGKDFLERIMKSAGRMDKLITDALNYTKILRHELELQPIDPGPLLRDMIESYPRFDPERAEIQIAPQFPKVMANAAGLTQCFSNLLSNAVKFVKPGETPRVQVWGEERGPMVRLWFEDNGIGIDQDHQQRIFYMFQQLNPEYEGTGIGLALVRKVVDRMKGKVGVESKVGEGSRFWVDLKRAEA